MGFLRSTAVHLRHVCVTCSNIHSIGIEAFLFQMESGLVAETAGRSSRRPAMGRCEHRRVIGLFKQSPHIGERITGIILHEVGALPAALVTGVSEAYSSLTRASLLK